MSKIRIKNFGPIKEGFKGLDDNGQPTEFMDIKEVTLFIGNQGSGKSTVAKLFSTVSWIEKAMVKGQLQDDELDTYNRFPKRLSYQRIDNYIKPNTEIEYQGKAYNFIFSNGNFKASKAPVNGYQLPKIMYVPAERNFLSVIDRPDKLKELPSPLYTFLDEFDKARNVFWEGLVLPLNKANFKYDRQNKIAHITESGYDLRLSETSSGFQSTVPLYLVTKYLAEWLTSEEDSSIKESSIEELRRLERAVKEIIDDTKLNPDIKQAVLRELSARRKPACFINIVEEPEQNLFPLSQRSVLNELLHYANLNKGNKLIMTTHSPYLVNYLTLAVKAFLVEEKVKVSARKEELNAKLSEIVPLQSLVNPRDLAIYELDKGEVIKLGNYKGLPSDENYLNERLAETNYLFDDLSEIEKECR